MFDEIYRGGRGRVIDLARGLTESELATVIPGSPEWTARDVVAHLTGVAADFLSGNTTDAPSRAWTAAQVEARRGKPIDELLAEWGDLSPAIETALAERELPLAVVFDVLTHEADLHEGLRLGRPSPSGWEQCVAAMAKQVTKRADGPGTLVLHVADDSYRGGDGDPVTELRADPYELFRGLVSRRSRAQMRGWDWTGNPEPYLESMPAFGPREDDQPVPRD